MKYLILTILALSACSTQPAKLTCAELAADAELKISALTVCKDTPGCTFTVGDLESATHAMKRAQACKP